MIKLSANMQGRLSSAGAQWAALLSALAVLGLLTLVDFYAGFRYHRELGFAEQANRATLIETSVEYQLKSIHFALGNLQAVIADSGKTIARADLRLRLGGILDSLRGVRTLAIFDTDGVMLISNRPELIGANFAHRDYFSKPFAQPDPARLYVSPPFRTVLGVLTINVSRAIVNRNGKFAGVVSATLEPEFFIHLLQSARTSEDMSILLTVGGERTVFVGLPDDASRWLGDVTEQGGIFNTETGASETPDAALHVVEVRGEKYAVAVRWAQTENMAQDNRIRVLLSRKLAVIEQNGYQGAAIKAGLYGSVVLLSVFGLLLFQRRQRTYLEKLTQQKRALRESEAFLLGIADNLPGLVSRWTHDLHCTFANRAYLEWFGRSPESMIGMRLQDLLGEHLFACSEPFIRAALCGESQRFERRLVKADGATGYMWVQLIPFLDGDGEYGFLALLSDIGELKQAQFALEQANAELTTRTLQAEEASAAKTRFLSSVSHELRTPLHTILGYVRLLLKETEGETRRQLVIVDRSSAQLLKLIDNLLEFNLGTQPTAALQEDAVALRELARQLEHTGQLMAQQSGNRLSVTLADDLPMAVWVDEQRLLQVLQNLLGNACKYTRNGIVTLGITREICDNGPRRVLANSVNDATKNTAGEGMGDAFCRLRFAVEDSGAGIAPQDLDHIFDVFNRGASTYGQPGLGLGLSIAQQWVRAMGGELQVHSTLGQGSRFFFTLELPTASMRPYTSESACNAFRETLAATPRTLLVVDDIAENRLLLRDLCERWGFKVLEAADGDHALSTCLTAAPPISAALIDQFMPGMDGWELLRRLRQIPALKHLPALLISASAAQKPAAFPPGIDFDVVLGKPLDEQALACFLCQRLRLVDWATACCLHPASTTALTTHAMANVVLPANELENFRHLLDLGRVLRIEKWAQELAAKNPDSTDFAEQVVQHCQAGDLHALEKLAAAAVPS